MKSMNGWIATQGFALLAMTNAGFFSCLPAFVVAALACLCKLGRCRRECARRRFQSAGQRGGLPGI
jgi:hypothetical protein